MAWLHIGYTDPPLRLGPGPAKLPIDEALRSSRAPRGERFSPEDRRAVQRGSAAFGQTGRRWLAELCGD